MITCPPPTPHISQFMLLFCFHSSEKRVRKFSLRVEKRILLLIVFLLKKKKKEKGIPPSSSLSINTRKEENHGASLARPLAIASLWVWVLCPLASCLSNLVVGGGRLIEMRSPALIWSG